MKDLFVLLFGARKAAVPIPAKAHATAHGTQCPLTRKQHTSAGTKEPKDDGEDCSLSSGN
jgi:hypothetical protein